MMQLVAMTLCGYLGWKRKPFYQWPLLTVLLAFLFGSLVTLAMGGGRTGPPFNAVLKSFVVSLIASPLATYWLARLIRAVILRRKTDE